ncbi:radical SAM protein [Candidatus Fermentibacteria bacterium]|nr:radical SAM protein [Candidatus Fermentibacteria bacterium]
MRPFPLARFGIRALQTWRGRLSRPYKLTFSVTERCNLRCRWCNIWRSDGEGELGLDEIDRFFAANAAFAWVDLTGGEITLRPDILEITHSASERLPHLFQFHFPTNGTMPLRVEAVVETALRAQIPKVVVSVSIDGPPELHDTLRGRPGTWEHAVETYGRVRRIGGEAYFGMTISHDNLKALSPTMEALAARVPGFTPRDLHLNIAHSTFYYGSPQLPALPQETVDTLAGFMKARGFPKNPVLLLEMLYQRKVGAYLSTHRSPVPCQALSSSLFVDARGSVFPCTSYDLRLGNLREMNYCLEKLWTAPETAALAHDIRHGTCPGCWTPCEAYQSIIANLARPSTWRAA